MVSGKRMVSILVALLIMMLVFGGCGGGSDSDAPPETDGNWIDVANTSWYNENNSSFTIRTAEQLAGLAKLTNSGIIFTGKTITLANDISLAGKEWTPISDTYDEAESFFNGTFDGGGHIISDMTILEEITEQNQDSSLGLFGYVREAVIKNVKLANIYINVIKRNDLWGMPKNGVGAIIGDITMGGAMTTNCASDGRIFTTGRMFSVGGIIGGIGRGGMVSNCTSDTDIFISSNYFSVGGIVGVIGDGTVTNCVSNGEISADIDSSTYIQSEMGGIVGHIYILGYANITTVIVTDCTSNGKISVTPDSSVNPGGVIGDIYIEPYIVIDEPPQPIVISGNKYNRTITGRQWGIGGHVLSDEGAVPFD